MTVNPQLIRRLRAQAVLFRRGAPRRRRPPRMRLPLPVERAYAAFIRRRIELIRKAFEDILRPQLARLAAEAGLQRPAPAAGDARADGWPEAAAQLITQIRLGLQNAQVSEADVADLAGQVSSWNKDEWRRQMVSVLGFDLVQAEPWLRDDLKAWAHENAGLISSLEDDAVAQVEKFTLRGLRAGDRHEDIAQQIAERLDVSESKAKFLARDQVGKLNASLTQHRQTAVGVDEYFWRTSGDDRVRATHAAHEGKKYRWDDPPEDTGHPGEDYNCRCTAEPDFSNLLEGLADLEEGDE